MYILYLLEKKTIKNTNYTVYISTNVSSISVLSVKYFWNKINKITFSLEKIQINLFPRWKFTNQKQSLARKEYKILIKIYTHFGREFTTENAKILFDKSWQRFSLG